MQTCSSVSRRALLGAALTMGLAAIAGCDARIQNEERVSDRLNDPMGVAETAAGFSAGSPTARKVVYVFFDMQCPHCGELWKSTKPLQDRVRFVWIPVSVLNPASLEQGAAILSAEDPVSAMDRHEANLATGGKGIAAASAAQTKREAVEKNTKLLKALGVQSVPYIVGRNENSDRVVTQIGMLPTETLSALLGI